MKVARDYQIQTEKALLENISAGIRSNLCVFSTGLGKTVLATMVHKAYDPKGITIFIVDRIELAEQAAASFQAAYPELRVEIEMADRSISDPDIIIASVQTIGRTGSKRIKNIPIDKITKVIVDEAHGCVAPIWTKVLHYLGVSKDNFDDKKILVGLSATPLRSSGESLGSVFDDIVGNFDTIYAIKNGWLTDIEVIDVQTTVDISSVKIVNGEYSQKELSAKIEVQARNAQIVSSYIQYAYGDPCIVFCASVNHAYEMAELFRQAGVPAQCVEGGTDKDDRKQWNQDFRNGKLLVLTNYGVYSTGTDFTELSCIIFARPIRSELLYRQMLGRGLRPSQYAFVDLYDTAQERVEAIVNSIKPFCKVIDLHDVTKHDVVSVPSLFGLNPKIKVPGKKIYKEVVEQLEVLKHEKHIDISKITDLSEISTIVNRRNMNITSYVVDDDVRKYSMNRWLSVGDTGYELTAPKNGVVLIIEQNLVGKWELLEYSMSTKLTKKLQTFQNKAGAFNIADQYIKENIDVIPSGGWEDKEITAKQVEQFSKFFAWKFRAKLLYYSNDRTSEGVRKIFMKDGTEVTRGIATTMINEFFAKGKKK